MKQSQLIQFIHDDVKELKKDVKELTKEVSNFKVKTARETGYIAGGISILTTFLFYIIKGGF